eukprot:1159763-Pelagomonas_calceolata.AAC.7
MGTRVARGKASCGPPVAPQLRVLQVREALAAGGLLAVTLTPFAVGQQCRSPPPLGALAAREKGVQALRVPPNPSGPPSSHKAASGRSHFQVLSA